MSTQNGFDVTIEQQIELIEAFGGPTKLRGLLEQRSGRRLTVQAVSAWKRRGIPYRYRANIAIEANHHNIAVPPGFMGEVL